jgi:hypothetical protein
MNNEDLDKWAAGFLGLEVNPRNDEMLLFPDGGFIMVDEWIPTVDLNQAFMVVGKMREKGFLLRLSEEYKEQVYRAYFSDIDYIRPDFPQYDPNPATAILKAAYAAVEGKE